MTKLRLSPDLSLPMDAATRRLAILAMSGAGKSNVAVVMAEQFFDAGIPWVAIDPKGDWWGVRSSKDGKGPGLAVPIFGGLHGDIPLEPTAGKLIGELIVEQRLTCVLDISEFAERQGMWGFLIDLGETLLRRNRQALHIFLEEADEILPQRTSEKGNLPKCLGVWQRVVKRGRFRGIGSSQITQRNASLNKDTLYQAEALIAMRVTGKADREAVRGWVEYNNASEEIVASLPTLADGEGWVSSPAWLKMTARTKFDRRRTFDSGATPVHLKGNAPVATLADVDLDVLSKRMAATIEKAKADDPKELRKRIVDLERDNRRLSAAPRNAAPKPVTVIDQKAIDRAVHSAVSTAVKPYADVLVIVKRTVSSLAAPAQQLSERLAALQAIDFNVKRDTNGNGHTSPAASTISINRNPLTRIVKPVPVPKVQRPDIAPRASSRDAGVGSLGKGERLILRAIAQYPDGADREQLTVLTGYKRSSRDTYLQRLQAAGFVEQQGTSLVATEAGIDELGADFEPLPTGEALREYWLNRLGGGEREILKVLIDADGEAVPRDELGETIGYKRSSRDTYIQRLAARKLVEAVGRGEVRASATLFDEARR